MKQPHASAATSQPYANATTPRPHPNATMSQPNTNAATSRSPPPLRATARRVDIGYRWRGGDDRCGTMMDTSAPPPPPCQPPPPMQHPKTLPRAPAHGVELGSNVEGRGMTGQREEGRIQGGGQDPSSLLPLYISICSSLN